MSLSSRANIASLAHSAETAVPLVVDLDGTLIKSDVLYESFFDAVARYGIRMLTKDLLFGFSKQALKSRLGELSQISYENLPYDQNVLRFIERARLEGRPVYLATASDRKHADAVAAHLGLFDGVFASDQSVNLRGKRKADALVLAFGANSFDYMGNDASDLDVWQVARKAIAVDIDGRIAATLGHMKPDAIVLGQRGFDVRALFKAMRLHQYAKNALVFVPLLTSHEFTWAALVQALLAFTAFSICASSVYLLNDLLDLQSDRMHPTKKQRPFASGRLSPAIGLILVPVLALAAFLVAILVSEWFCAVVALYLVLTTAYSFSLKRKMVLDVVVLAMLYTLRVIAGAVAIDVVVSEWLLAFSLLIFTSLALVKRYTELSVRLHEGLDDPSNRNYKVTDLPVIAALAAAAGMNSITIIALYVSSESVRELYTYPALLWGLCPLFLYWISRVLMLAHRRIMEEDPISFALQDIRSWVVGASSIGVVLAAL